MTYEVVSIEDVIAENTKLKCELECAEAWETYAVDKMDDQQAQLERQKAIVAIMSKRVGQLEAQVAELKVTALVKEVE